MCIFWYITSVYQWLFFSFQFSFNILYTVDIMCLRVRIILKLKWKFHEALNTIFMHTFLLIFTSWVKVLCQIIIITSFVTVLGVGIKRVDLIVEADSSNWQNSMCTAPPGP